MKNLNKIVSITLLSFVMVFTSAFTTSKKENVIMLVTLEVENFTEWKKSFDAGAPIREKAGIKVLSVCSSIENENQVVVIEEAENLKAAQDFLSVLKSKQKNGDMSKLDVKIFNKVD